MNKNIFFIILLLFTMNVSHGKISSEIAVALYCPDASFYSSAVEKINRLGKVKIIERENLKPLMKEMALKQTGLVSSSFRSKLSAIDYAVIIKKTDDTYFYRIISIKNGAVLYSFSGYRSIALKKLTMNLQALVSFRILATLKSSDDGISVDITPYKGKKSYKYGDTFKFYVESESDGYLYILDVDPLGNITILMPYGPFKQYKIKADKRICIPDDLKGPGGESIHFKIKEPPGIERIKVFITKHPINIHQLSGVMKGYLSTVDSNKNNSFIRGISVTVSSMKKSDWGAAQLTIKISPK